jgi:hypothetical protein
MDSFGIVPELISRFHNDISWTGYQVITLENPINAGLADEGALM